MPRALFADLHMSAIQRAVAKLDIPQGTVLRLLLPEGSEANLAPIKAAWTKMTGFEVVHELSDVDDINARIAEDLLLETADYDVALPATFGLPDLAYSNAVLSLEPFLAKCPNAYSEEGHLYTVGNRFEGETYGLQTDGDVYLMFYRKNLMEDPEEGKAYADQFGTALDIPTDWNELDRQMRFFHRPEQKMYGGTLFRAPGYLAWEFLARFEAEGGQLFDDQFRPQFNGEAAVKVLSDLIQATSYLHPGSGFGTLFENWDRFTSDQVYANIGWGGSQKSFNAPGSPLRGNLRYSALPRGKGSGRGYFNWGWSYVIPTSAPYPELSFLFSALAMDPEISTTAVQQIDGYFDPFHERHYSDPVIQEVYSPSFLEVHRSAMLAAGHDIYLPGYGNYLAALNENIHAALTGDLSEDLALERMQIEWGRITLEFGGDSQARRWAALRSTG
ncbi:extracellular solute-binding protein [Poseidonocella pacifica]|nr:extracellular solute-binding protein [Poseidonocella pacifica]